MATYRGNIVDIINREIYKGEIEIADGIIKSIKKKQVEQNHYILPGLINSHVHIESTMLSPSAYANIAVQHGTVAAVSDPHEIANVLGVKGIDYMIEEGKTVPLKFFFGAPSCVPATNLETSGAKLDSKILDKLLRSNDIYYLSELMDFPGVINEETDIIEKIKSAKKYNKPIDGHAPGLTGPNLYKYAKSGISTDHECVDIKEAEEKIKAGMKIQIREGSAAKNFNALFSLIDNYPEKVMLCTDDSHPDDLINGHINSIIKMGLNKGLNFFNLLQTASLNPKTHYNLNVGMLQTGDPADFIIIDNPQNFNILKTVIEGKEVYKNGKTLFKISPAKEINNFKIPALQNKDINLFDKRTSLPVINIIDKELLTTCSFHKPTVYNGNFVSNTETDILKIVVINRYNKSAKPAIGFIKGLGLKSGAICSSVAHDSHNLVAAGASDKEIIMAINKVVEMKGGLAVAYNNQTSGIQLEIAGLMTNMNAYELAEKYKLLQNIVKSLGSPLHSPFMTLAFMTLLPIPEIKISDKGVFDVINQKYY